jgi:Fe(3+) dicitrate transport protein
LLPGRVEVTAEAPGFAARTVEARVTAGVETRLDLPLEIGSLTEAVQVVPDRLVAGKEAARRIPGSVEVLDLAELETSRVVTTAEVLRKASGVHVRDEEGFGLRPNIGVRGLNPTRSSRVLLLEDGIPLAYAPYGDNAAYYHPPVERFERIELLKGAGQIAYGPMTVGGVINYVTATPPGTPRGVGSASIGTRGYFNAQAGWGTTLGRTGLLLDFMRKQGDGAREHISSELDDVNVKLVSRLADRHVLTFRASYYGEDSNITYSGLREAEYRASPRQNPFRNDFFYVDRAGVSATHTFTITDRLAATTNVYGSGFRRHWWRQSSNSSQRPNDAADPACGGMANLNTTCGNEGRLRQYVLWGVEPRVRAVGRVGALTNETDLGVRLHVEDQERRQENGAAPTSRSGTLVENNERQNVAWSGFFQNRFIVGSWSVTPGVRVERVGYERTNRLAGVSGRTDLVEVIPGVGGAYSPGGRFTVFAGVHRGFTPPRTEDVINNTTGGVVELDPERSWNYEAGFRGRIARGLQLDAAIFRLDYENQVIPATLAGGVGSALTNAGETLHQGLEVSARADSAPWRPARVNFYARTAYTWLPTAEFRGTRFSSVPGFGSTTVGGNRLPYAPEHLLTASFGAAHASGLDLNVEAVLTGAQYGDDLNTIAPTPDGQRGLIEGYTLWNAAANYAASRRITLFVAVKNLLDRTVIVDRSRGILPGAPRLMQAGVKVAF